MANQETVDQYVIGEIKAMLAALEAAGSATDPLDRWTPSDQTRFLRALAEQGIDKLEAAENEYFDYMAQCILLAGENMQDARLQILEQRLDKLENPPVDLAETLLNASLMLIAEIVIANGAWVAIPALYALSRSRGYRRKLSKAKLTGVNRPIDRKVAEIEDKLDDLLKRRPDAVAKIRLTHRRNGHPDAGAAAALELQKIDRDFAAEGRRLHTLQALRATSDSVAEKAIKAIEKGPSLNDERMNTLMRDVTAEVTIERIGEAVGEDFAATVTGVGSQSSTTATAFETSDLLSDYLAALQSDKRISGDSWAALRFHIRVVPDDDLWGSAIVQNVLARAIEADYWSVEPSRYGGTERSVFVLGFESMLWLHWFIFNGLLAVEPFNDEPWAFTPPVLAYGKATKGYVVTEVRLKSMTAPDGMEIETFYYSGSLYSGAARLGDEQAEYLYQKFVRRYFLANPDAAPAGITFEVERYDEAWKMEKKGWVLDNYDRQARIEEIKILVVEYFRQERSRIDQDGSTSGAGGAAGKKIRDTMREMLGLEPSDHPLENMLDQLPDGTEFPDPPLLTQTAVEEAALLASESAGADVRERTWLISDAQALLESAIADLDLQITGFDDGRPASGDDPLRTIELFKDRLRRRYAEFLTTADQDRERLAAVQNEHANRITQLLDWVPPRDALSSWHWFGDEPTPV